MNSPTSSFCDLVFSSPVSTSTERGSTSARRRLSSTGVTPVLRGHADLVELPSLARDALGLRKREHGHARAAEGVHVAELGDADQLVGASRLLAGDADAIAHVVATPVGRLLVDHDLAVGRGLPALDDSRTRRRARAAPRRRTWARRCRRSDRRPCRGWPPAGRRSRPRPCQRPRSCATRLEHGRRERRLLAVVGLDGLARRDHGVDALVRLREDPVERAVDRVREDVGPRDHHHPQDDREGGEEGPQLARPEIAQRNRGHVRVPTLSRS